MSNEAIVAACGELGRRNFVANHDGNISVRLGAGRFLVTPTAFRKADVRGVDLLVVAEDGAVLQGRHRLFSEWQLHRTVFAARPDIGAVVHAHPPNATAMACAGRPLTTTFQAEAVVSLGPQLGWVPFSLPGSERLESEVDAAARGANAALLAGHGVLAWGVDLTMAMARLELVEHLARITLLAPGAGVTALATAQVAVLTAKHRKAGLAAPGAES